MEWPDWLQDWHVWVALSITFGAAEVFSLDLVLLMLAGGALVGVVTALLGVPVAMQVLASIAGAVALLALVRPSVVRRLHAGPHLTLGHDALVGKQGVVIEEISDQRAGQIRVAGEVWTARPYDENEVIEPGARVDVFEIRGATALVHRIPMLDQ